jgi:hypothetical protein
MRKVGLLATCYSRVGIPWFGLRMYRRSVLRSDHLAPGLVYVLENNVLLCVD